MTSKMVRLTAMVMLISSVFGFAPQGLRGSTEISISLEKAPSMAPTGMQGVTETSTYLKPVTIIAPVVMQGISAETSKSLEMAPSMAPTGMQGVTENWMMVGPPSNVRNGQNIGFDGVTMDTGKALNFVSRLTPDWTTATLIRDKRGSMYLQPTWFEPPVVAFKLDAEARNYAKENRGIDIIITSIVFTVMQYGIGYVNITCLPNYRVETGVQGNYYGVWSAEINFKIGADEVFVVVEGEGFSAFAIEDLVIQSK